MATCWDRDPHIVAVCALAHQDEHSAGCELSCGSAGAAGQRYSPGTGDYFW